MEGNRSARHERQWLASLKYNWREHAVWHTSIVDITAPQLLDVMIELQKRVSETARRIYQRLHAVLDDAQFRGLVLGNPRLRSHGVP